MDVGEKTRGVGALLTKLSLVVYKTISWIFQGWQKMRGENTGPNFFCCIGLNSVFGPVQR
jgi:hypothetical protein